MYILLTRSEDNEHPRLSIFSDFDLMNFEYNLFVEENMIVDPPKMDKDEWDQPDKSTAFLYLRGPKQERFYIEIAKRNCPCNTKPF